MKNTFSGKITSAAGALETVTLGCDVSSVVVNNVTQNEVYELFNDGTNSVGISTAGATGVVTQSATTLAATTGGFTIAAAALSTNDVLYYVAHRLA